eukprot:GGOE01018757.1.p1 GENE.GGOE01018757.1~~GGOE01018757.1.p1  ORF type:complete len:668 (-),score=225.53 GGOE01018757.1:40-2043(-)
MASSSEKWDCAGLLKKKNHLTRSSHRWFALRGQELFYFAEQTDIHPKYIINLYGAKATLLPDGVSFELVGTNFPKGESLLLKAKSAADAASWVRALDAAIANAHPTVDTGVKGPHVNWAVAKVERVLKVDLNGDGHVGMSKTPLTLDLQRNRELNLRMRSAMQRWGLSAAQITDIVSSVDPRIVELACRKERVLLARRRVMDELIDTLGERVVHKMHKLDAFNQLESSSKKVLFGTAGDVVLSAKVTLQWGRYPQPSFGKDMLQLFHHRSIYLDAVSFGCCPIPVLDAREQWDIVNQVDPVLWRFRSLMLRLKETSSRMALFIQADPSDVQFLLNAPTGISTILKSQAWKVGDRIVLLSCDFHHTLAAAHSVAAQFGVEVVVLPITFPSTEEQLLAVVEATLKSLQGLSPKLACVPHVTPDGWQLPAKKLTKLFHRYGVAVVMDGSLAVGHFDVNVGNIAADYYIASLDKWLYAPQGVGFLVVAPHKQEGLFPLTVSYFAGQGYEKEFTYTGLQDFGSYTTVMQSLEFTEKVCRGAKESQAWCCQLAARMVHVLEAMWGTRVVQSVNGEACYGRLPVIPVPGGEHQTPDVAHRLMHYLAICHNINVFCFIGTYDIPRLCVRLTAQVFNDVSDAEALGHAVLGLGRNYNQLPYIPSQMALDSIVYMEG